MTEKRIKDLKDKIALLQILAEGCRRHPADRAWRPATGKCAPCVTMWQARCNLNQLQEDSAARQQATLLPIPFLGAFFWLPHSGHFTLATSLWPPITG